MLQQLEDEIIAMLEQDSCAYSMQCAESNYGSEVRCDDHVMCPQFRTYVVEYVNNQMNEYAEEVISKSL